MSPGACGGQKREAGPPKLGTGRGCVSPDWVTIEAFPFIYPYPLKHTGYS